MAIPTTTATPAAANQFSEQFGRAMENIATKFADAAEHLDAARDDLLAFADFPHGDLAPDLVQQPARAPE